MKKRHPRSLCAYCGERPAVTEDHVIGRGFLPVRLRGNLPKVPACALCNNKKSEYERYAMAVFPFGSMHEAGDEILKTRVKERLQKDQRLWRQLRDGRVSIVGINRDGSTVTTSGVPFDHEKSLALFRMIITGLLCHHCGAPLPPSYVVRVFSLTDFGLGLFKQHILSLTPDHLREVSLAGGSFAYQFTRSPEDPFFTAWVLNVYNSFNMCGTTETGELLRVHIAALAGPEEVNRMADAIEKMKVQPGNAGDCVQPSASRSSVHNA